MRLHLDALDVEDLPQIAVWRNKAADHLRTPVLTVKSRQRDWLDRITHNPTWAPFAVRTIKRPTLVGYAALSRIELVNRVAEVSVLCGDPKDEPEALTLLCATAFAILNIQRLETETYTKDRAALFQGAGFTRYGVRTRALWRWNKWNDTELWELLRPTSRS